jgi:lipopolysaccharide export system protein LptA
MRSARWLLLVVIVMIVAAVGSRYYLQKQIEEKRAPRAPGLLPVRLSGAMQDWVWTYNDRNRPVAEIRAKNSRQISDAQLVDLDDVELHIFAKDGKHYDKVRCMKAESDLNRKTLYSDGDVQITMGVPDEGVPPGHLVFIRSTGVTFDTNTGKASTDRLASFTFDRGDGHAVGAFYDPDTKELRMQSQVEMNWRGETPDTKVMKVQTDLLVYKEKEQHAFLTPWSRLTRDNMVLDAGDADVFLAQGHIRNVIAQKPRGTNRDPGRDLEYAADRMDMSLNADGEIDRILGTGNARLVSTSKDTRTTVTCDHLALEFDTSSGESTLKSAIADGSVMAQSDPTLLEGPSVPQTRILHTKTLLMQMRPGGREIDSVETHTPGYVEFLANRPGQPYRRLDGTEIWITYGPENRIQKFRSVNVTTRTVGDRKPGQKEAPVSLTSSKDLNAEFDPKTSQLVRMEQRTDFRYEEGDRKARAAHATLDQQKNVMFLEGGARFSDATGSTSADQIIMDQKSGDVDAKGHVQSTRMPDRKGPPSAMLSQDEPMQATAGHMVSTNHNQKVHYEGDAFVWQGANQVRADQVEIDREKRRLEASGHLSTQFVDKPKEDAKEKTAPLYTVVTAARMVYTDQDRLARYTEGAHLTRPGMDVKATEIRAILNDDKDADSRVDKAYADGQAEILRTSTSPDRTRKGTADHAVYEVAEDKITLFGGHPLFLDSLRGFTRGTQLIYFSDSDRLLVDGESAEPAKSRIKRGK